MNEITVTGLLKRDPDGRRFGPGYLYHMEASRKSGATDTLMVLSPDEGLTEGFVKLEGMLRAEYIHPIGVPVFIVPAFVSPADENSLPELASDACITGVVKETPVCRGTKKGRKIANIRLVTDEGTVPVLIWGKDAQEAPSLYTEGMTVTVAGRLQSREYPDRKNPGQNRTTYELSARKVAVGESFEE